MNPRPRGSRQLVHNSPVLSLIRHPRPDGPHDPEEHPPSLWLSSPLDPMSDRYTDPEFARAALITIDTQRDVLDGGPLEITGTTQALPAMSMLIEEFRRCERPIVHIVRLYETDGANVDICRRQAVEEGARLLPPGEQGSQLALELLPDARLALDDELLLAGGIQWLGADEVVIYKPRWGAFYDTPLERHLRERDVTTLVFCGCNFPNCPRTSIYEASERDFRVVLARDGISGLYERGERELASIGVRLMDTQPVVEELARAAAQAAPPGTLTQP
jgi:nicotinamidase-related amidase